MAYISTASDMIKALKRETFVGVVLYEGESMIDGNPIVCIANRIAGRSSQNEKTGSMVQTFIIRSDVRPLEALKSGADYSVCGSCLARPANEGFCYVNVGRSVESVFGAYKRNRYARPHVDYDPAILSDLFDGSIFRLGSYGDPAAVPFDVWNVATSKAKARNGYTHQWRNRPEFAALCMASCDTESDHIEAKAMGFRTFRIRLATDSLAPKEIACPASAESGHKTQCADCRACGGLSAKAKADVAIVAHGSTAKRYELWRAKIAA